MCANINTPAYVIGKEYSNQLARNARQKFLSIYDVAGAMTRVSQFGDQNPKSVYLRFSTTGFALNCVVYNSLLHDPRFNTTMTQSIGSSGLQM